MEEHEIKTIGALVILLTKLGVFFNGTFLKKIWNPEKNSHAESNSTDNNRAAAWHLYVEMETRITTQSLAPGQGDEKTALDSVYSLFQTTRDILHEQGPDCVVFAKIAIEILNQKVRPFTERWHTRSIAGDFDDPAACDEFWDELKPLQEVLRAYTRTLAVLAGIEDITHLSEE